MAGRAGTGEAAEGAGGLAARLRARIAAAGPIPLADFMAAALGDPAAGYYATRDPLGAAGDFVTAPEISQMFGELLGLWCADRWVAMGRPAVLNYVELGPGRGTLAADALRAMRGVAGLPAALRVHLVETGTVLRARQATALAGWPVTWHERLATVPEGPMVLLANEFLDALPVRQYVRTGNEWRERCVDWDSADQRFRFVPGPAAPEAAALAAPAPAAPAPAAPAPAAPCGEAWSAGAPVPEGAIQEVRPEAVAVLAQIGRRVVRAGGAAMFVDYGHAVAGLGDTLQAVRAHRRADPLTEPGRADLTAHVDFAAASRAARRVGARVDGPVPQRDLLRLLGIELRARTLLGRASPEQAAGIAAALHRLIDPAQMGTLFLALAVSDPALGPAPGFPPVPPA